MQHDSDADMQANGTATPTYRTLDASYDCMDEAHVSGK